MQIHKYLRNILFAMILLYFAQGSLYPNGSILSKIVLFVYLFISLYYAVLFVVENKKDYIGRILLVFISINVVYWLLGDKGGVQHGEFMGSPFDQIKKILVALLTYFPFYYYSTRKYLTEKSLMVFYVLFFIVSILTFFTTSQAMTELTGSNDVVNSSSYLFLSLLPLSIVFWRKKYLFIISFLLSLVFILFAAKRGPIVGVILIGIIVFYYWWISGKRMFSLWHILTILVTFVSAIYIGKYIIENNSLLQMRFQSMLEGDSSGRDVIYSTLFDKWLYSDSVINFLFGYGFFASAHITGIVAHNDWLEIVTSLGLIGGVIYAIFFILVIKFIVTRNKWSIQDKTMISVILIVLLIKSMFSMGYTSTDTMPVLMCLAYLTGKNWNLEVRRKLNLFVVKKKLQKIKSNL